MRNSRAKNIGWRIDYFLVDNILNEPKLKDVFESEKNTLTTENKKQVEDLYNKFTKNGENIMEENNKTPQLPVFLMFAYVFWILLVFIWYAIAGFTKQKTAMHDIIAKTRVIKGRL
jgi:ATP-dependent Zn protease